MTAAPGAHTSTPVSNASPPPPCVRLRMVRECCRAVCNAQRRELFGVPVAGPPGSLP